MTETHTNNPLVDNFVSEYGRYQALAEGAMSQMSDAALNHVAGPDCNSVAMIVWHMSGNLQSRFTSFLTEDGEKPWRQRDDEFADRTCSREEVMQMWKGAWAVIAREVCTLSDADLSRVVTIRQQPLTVHAALCRSIAHVAYHVGQIVLLARMTAEEPWRSLSIPKGQSAEYNKKPTGEKGPRLVK